ncbi:MAG: hypothetical protein VB062_01590 [Christensenella sp.]|nr:hypothetical protein [Christensenella sp.]
MNRTIRLNRLLALWIVLALALVVPAIALAEGGPTATLYSPSTGASTSGNQKIIFSLSEQVSLVSGRNITITPAGGTPSVAAATSGTRLGNASTGPWYVSYKLSDFSPALTLTPNTTYNVLAQAGAFEAASTPSAEATGTFTTGDAGGTLVIYTKTNNQTLQTGGVDIVSGSAVAGGSPITAINTSDGSYVPVKTVYVNGSKTDGVALSSYVPSGELEVYYTRTDGTLTGSAAISGQEYIGGELSGTVSDLNQPDTSGIRFQWVRVGDGGNELLESGGISIKHPVVAADLGKVIRLDVTDTTLTSGTLSDTTGTIAKAPYTGSVQDPALESSTGTSITLVSVSGYEYSRDGATWRTDPTFSGLTAGTPYDFYQRVAETTTTLASGTSNKVTLSIKATLTGTVSISGTAQSGVALTGSITGTTNASGTITYAWSRGGTPVGTNSATYTPNAADVNSTLTLTISTSEQNGTISATTAAVKKAANTTVPAAPTMASATATTITLNATGGYQYSLGGTYWQDTTTFNNLVAGATYTFYQRVAETSAVLASGASTGANFTTLPTLSGTILSSGEARYGITMTVNLSGTNNTGTLTYTWKRGTMVVGTGTSYAVQAADVSNTLSVEVTSSVQGGSVTRSFGTVAKAYYVGNAPDAPTRSSRTTTKIVLKAVDGYEYSRGGTTWQDSTTFSGLKAGTSYTFYQRVKATATTEASDKSAAYKTSTVASSTSDGGDADTPSKTPTPKPGTTPTNGASGTTLYNYTLTDDNTRILYSTMKSLAEGNKTQDVTIKQSNVEFTFPKGTMTDTYTQLWYDFGTTINNSIAEQTAKQIAGDAYVATIHYNYSGELPGKANIRFWLGAAQAGKTLYYYLLNADNTLTFQQTSTVDSTGWASVTQTHCSDYVFLSRDIASASASPSVSPSADPSVSPLPSPSASPEQNGGGFTSDGWFIAAIILIAVALIVGGIWLYTKSRDDRMDDDDDDTDF